MATWHTLLLSNSLAAIPLSQIARVWPFSLGRIFDRRSEQGLFLDHIIESIELVEQYIQTR